MIKLNVHEAKTHLSAYLDRLAQGETIILCRRNVPIAEIRPISEPPSEKRPIGLAKGSFSIPDSFYSPLPDETVRSFEGEGE